MLPIPRDRLVRLVTRTIMSAPIAPAGTTFEDLSGVSTAAFSNPYDALIAASEDDPVSNFVPPGPVLVNTVLRVKCKHVTILIGPQGIASRS